jgi:hypothetical protein
MSEELTNSPDAAVESQSSAPAGVGYDSAPVSSPAQSAPQAEGFDSPFSAFRALPEFQGQDDLTIAQNLYRAFNGYGETQRQLQQFQSLIPHTTDYVQNREKYQQWLAAQQEASKPKAPEQPKWWNPPSIEDTYKSYIIRDPQTGKEVIDPNAPFEAQQALRKYQDYTANFARKLVTDPENTLKPFVEQVAMQKAQELVQQHLNQYQTTNYVQDLERQNSDWLYNPDGSVSREGQAIQGYIQQAQQIGIQDPKARWQYATGMLQRDLLNLRYQQMQQAAPQAPSQGFAPQQPPMQPQAPVDPVAQQNMQFLRERATRAPNRSAGTTEPRAPRPRMSFEERLKSQLVNDGVL